MPTNLKPTFAGSLRWTGVPLIDGVHLLEQSIPGFTDEQTAMIVRAGSCVQDMPEPHATESFHINALLTRRLGHNIQRNPLFEHRLVVSVYDVDLETINWILYDSIRGVA